MKIVKVNVADIYKYDSEANKHSPILSKNGGNTSMRINVQTPALAFGQDEAFYSSQMNE